MQKISSRTVRSLGALAAACLFPSLAWGHPGHGMHSWSDGFNHPLHGLDHMAVMVAVGIWAAQQQGRAAWALPLTFLSVMAVGGVAGAMGFAIPGSETMIGVSVVALGLLVLLRAKVNVMVGVGTVGLFAFFHGYAHGSEMPDATGLGSYGLGFLVATALLHGVGFAATRCAATFAMRRVMKPVRL